MKINDYSEDMWYVGLGGSVSMLLFMIVGLVVGSINMLVAGLVVFVLAVYVTCVGIVLELTQ